MKSVPEDNGNGDECPVVNVSWLDAIDFLNRLSDDMGLPRCYERHGDEVSYVSLVVRAPSRWPVDGCFVVVASPRTN